MAFDLVKRSAEQFAISDPVISVTLEWERSVVMGTPVDGDLSIAMLGGSAGDRMLSDRGLVFYNNIRSEDGALLHRGDAIEGGHADEAEVIELQLGKVNPDIWHLLIFVTVYEARARGHSIGDLSGATIRVRRGGGGATLMRAMVPPRPLTSRADGYLIGRVSRTADGWEFVQQAGEFLGGLQQVISKYGPA